MHNEIIYTTEQLLQAIEGTGGIMLTIANRLRCNWMTAQKKVRENEEASIALQCEKERVLDMSEGVIYKSVEAGTKENPDILTRQAARQDAKWLLATLGKKRGYSERHEITGEDGKDLFGAFLENLKK